MTEDLNKQPTEFTKEELDKAEWERFPHLMSRRKSLRLLFLGTAGMVIYAGIEKWREKRK